MNHNRLIEILSESKAEFVQGDFWGEASVGNGFTRRWEIDRSDAAGAEQFLRFYGSVDNYNDVASDRFYSVTDPRVSGGTRTGLYRTGRVQARREEEPSGSVETWYVYQELREGFITSLIPSGGSSPAVDWSEFFTLKESGYHSNHEMPVLRVANVAGAAVHDLVAYLNQDTFTDIEYRDDTLSGTWRRIKVESLRQDDGSYVIDVYLTDSANTELYFYYRANSGAIRGHLLKWDTSEELIEEYLEERYFNADGEVQFGPVGKIVVSGGGEASANEEYLLQEVLDGNHYKFAPYRDPTLVLESDYYISTVGSTIVGDYTYYSLFKTYLNGSPTERLYRSTTPLLSEGDATAPITETWAVDAGPTSAPLITATVDAWTLRGDAPGRTVAHRGTVREQDTRLYRHEIEIVWEIEQTLYDSDRTTEVPGSTLPRAGTPVVSQWWERGNNTDKLPEKPSTIYDATNGVWAEQYTMQSPPEILPNGLYNWLLNCQRFELPAAMLSDSKPKWILHARQSRTDKQKSTVSIDSQTVARLINGLLDGDAIQSTTSIPWELGTQTWDWADTTFSVDDVVYDEDVAKWYICITAITSATGIRPSQDASNWTQTSEAPYGWDTETHGEWNSQYVKTYVHTASNEQNVLWNLDHTEIGGIETENYLTYLQTGDNDSTYWKSRYEDVDDEWNRWFIPSAYYSSETGTSGTNSGPYGSVIYIDTSTLSQLSSQVFGGGSIGGTLTKQTAASNFTGLYRGNTAGIFDACQHGSVIWFTDSLVGGNGLPAAFYCVKPTSQGNDFPLFAMIYGDYDESVYGIKEGNSGQIYSASTVEDATHTLKEVSLLSTTELIGIKSYAGSALYYEGVNGSGPGSWVYSDSLISDENGYPYLVANTASLLRFYVDQSNLVPAQITIGTGDDEQNMSNFNLLPRFTYGKDKYGNPSLLEIIRKTRRKIETVIYRKYCAVHPAMLTDIGAYIPAGFAEDDNEWPTDSTQSRQLWVDSNILIKYRISDSPVEMAGARFYYAEATIEFYGEEQADTAETSARDGAQRNFPEVDPDTGMAMIYSVPKEVSSLFGINSLGSGSTRQAPSRWGEITKVIDQFDVESAT